MKTVTKKPRVKPATASALPSRETIKAFLKEAEQTVGLREVARAFGVKACLLYTSSSDFGIALQRDEPYMTAGPEGVALDEDVMRDHAPIHAGEDVPDHGLGWGVGVGAVLAVAEEGGAEVRVQTLAKAHKAAGLGVDLRIAGLGGDLGQQLHAERAVAERGNIVAPDSAAEEVQRRLVMQLIVPAAVGRLADHLVEAVLHLSLIHI